MQSPEDRWGDLFVAVQLGEVFEDGKTFVDCEPRRGTAEILQAYQHRKDRPDFELRAFVMEYFALPKAYGSDFEADPGRSMREHIQTLWPVLTRQPDEPGTSSLLRLPHPYVVPGGRFREIYYWDSYFTMLGLMEDGQTALVRHMIDNFAYLIDTVGFIPNGNRTYFLSRSQPPFFAFMVELLAQHSSDDVYVNYLPQLLREYRFWMRGSEGVKAGAQAVEHVVRVGEDQILNRYYDLLDTPRAESYREDVATAAAHSDRNPQQLYRDLRAACESGWDFSSRWLADGETLGTIHTTDIIPVDLNALLYRLELAIGRAYEVNLDEGQAAAYRKTATARERAINRYCWDDETGYYRDYNFRTTAFTPVLSMAGVYPLFCGLAPHDRAARVAEKLSTAFLRPGGYTSTLLDTGQQWDRPNGWAPLQWVAYQGLSTYAQHDLAARGRDAWLTNNERVYTNTTKMVEKYDVENISAEAGGGEYPLQDGFGWSNGVVRALQATLKTNDA